MTFLETPRFPDSLAFNNFEAATEWSTDVVEVFSGAEQRNANWTQARHRYSADMIPWRESDVLAFKAWVQVLKGRAIGFRLRDPLDHADDGAGYLGTGYGTGLPTYPMVKRYAVGALTHDRRITKPGAVTLKRNGSAVAVGIGTGQATVDAATGVATFAAIATSGISTITPGATTDVQLSTAVGIVVGGMLHLSGIGGTLGAALNGKAWPVTAVAAATYTLAVSTTGLTGATTGYGTRYPQPDDALTWVGDFEIPARLDTDSVRFDPRGNGIWQPVGLTIVEIRQ